VIKRLFCLRWVNFKLALVGQYYCGGDNWDDFSFRTSFQVFYCDHDFNVHALGGCKIAKRGQLPNQEHTEKTMHREFGALDEEYISLGQDVEYYERIRSLRERERKSILLGLQDVANNQSKLDIFRKEPVFRESLMRTVSLLSISGQFNRVLSGGDLGEDFGFTFQPNFGNQNNKTKLTFDTCKDTMPPTNIHVLIGKNGVGKSSILYKLSRSICLDDPSAGSYSANMSTDTYGHGVKYFSRVVAVAFSAFDSFSPLYEVDPDRSEVKYSYLGLKKYSEDGELQIKTTSEITGEFIEHFESCIKLGKKSRFDKTLEALESDRLISDLRLSRYFEENGKSLEDLREAFDTLSSGHKVVLLSAVALVNLVESHTLVLIDEPESHLHPPLLSAFIRAISDLVDFRNGMGLIATHSPVVLQEVPKLCVYKLTRFGNLLKSERPRIETFGENVGTLTSEIFELEVTETGYHSLLDDASENFPNYKEAKAHFSNQLGTEAKFILRSMMEE